jgi:hypothetical protein
MARREDLKDKLKLKEIEQPELNFDPKKFRDNYAQVRNDKHFIKLIGGRDNLKNYEDLVKIANALPNSNVSNLAFNMKVMAALATGVTVLSGGTVALKGTATALASDAVLRKYISNKKAVDKLVQYAKNPTPENTKIVNNTFKNQFGEDINQVNSKLAKVINGLSDSDKAKLGITAIHALPEEDKNGM